MIVSGLFYLISNGALLFGAIKNNAIAVLVNLVCTVFIIILAMFSIYIIKIAIVSKNDPDQETPLGVAIREMGYWSMIAVAIVGGLFSTYFWVCNYSFYKELKEGNANPV